VELEDAFEFCGCFGVFLDAVVGWDDEFRMHRFEVGRPVGDHAVAAIG
jgi:hypothetical protein